MKSTQSTGFTIKRVALTEKGFSYDTFRLTGWLDGQRVRKQFKSREEALGEKNRLEVQAANAEGLICSINTRLNQTQIVEAEAAFHRLGDKSLTSAVNWYLETYRPPCVEKPLGEAVTAFLAAHAAGVVPRHHDEVRRQLQRLRDHLTACRAARKGERLAR